MTTKLAVFNRESIDHTKLKAYQNDGWDVGLVGNGLDCTSYKIHTSECKQGMFYGSDEKEVYSVSVAQNNDVHIVFADGSSTVRSHEYNQEVWVRDHSIRAEVEKMRTLLKELDIKLGLLCPDNGFSVYYVRPDEEYYQTYHRTTSCFEGKGLNFRLPNDGMLQLIKEAFHYKEYRTVSIRLWWLYREWQERTDDEFVFIE